MNVFDLNFFFFRHLVPSTSLDFVVVKSKHYTPWDKRVFHCHSVVYSPLQNTLLKSNPWLARKSILELWNDKDSVPFSLPENKNKTTNSQASQLLLNNLKILSLSIVNDQRPRAVTLTYLTNELYVRGRPVERFRENIKIKRFYNIPAEKGMQKTN